MNALARFATCVGFLDTHKFCEQHRNMQDGAIRREESLDLRAHVMEYGVGIYLGLNEIKSPN